MPILHLPSRFSGNGGELELNYGNWQTRDLVSALVPDSSGKVLSPIGVINRLPLNDLSSVLPGTDGRGHGPTAGSIFVNTVQGGPYPQEAGFFHNFLPAFTITCWVYSASTQPSNNYYNILSRGGLFVSNTNFSFGIRRRPSPVGNTGYCYAYNGSALRPAIAFGEGAGEWSTTAALLADDSWQFMAVSWQSARQLWYRGDPSLTKVGHAGLVNNWSSLGTNGTDGGQPVWYGRCSSHTSSSYPFLGYTKDVRLYRRALIVDEIEDIYYNWHDAYKASSPISYFFPTAGGTTYFQSVSGSITSTGAINKSTLKDVVGSITTSGSISKLILKEVIGSTTPTGDVSKLTTKTFTGSTTITGDVIPQSLFTQAISGTTTPTGTVSKSTLKAVIGSITASGLVSKLTSTNVAGEITPTGDVNKETSITVSGSITATGEVLLTLFQLVVGSITPTGTASGFKFTPTPSEETGGGMSMFKKLLRKRKR